jgi:uncharacterized protein (DUF2141 family)
MQPLRLAVAFLATLGTVWFTNQAIAITTNSNVTVNLEGLKNKKGQVCLSLFNASKGFPTSGDRAIQARCFKITETRQQVTFKNLKAGNYAVAVIHDINGDSTLNRNFLGIPTEGFGFSRNPAITSGPPKFQDSAFLVIGPSTQIDIQLQYLLGG